MVHFLKKNSVFCMVFVYIIMNLISSNAVFAQTRDYTEQNKWGGEFSAIGIGVFSLYQGKLTYALNSDSQFKTELGLGFLIQPESTRQTSEAFNSDGIYSATQASVAARQYFWKGLHFEEVINFGNAGISDSKVDGNDYESFVVFSQTFLGYKFDLYKNNKINFFIIGQAGVGYVPYSSDPWPTAEPNSSSVYPLGDLKIGINF